MVGEGWVVLAIIQYMRFLLYKRFGNNYCSMDVFCDYKKKMYSNAKKSTRLIQAEVFRVFASCFSGPYCSLQTIWKRSIRGGERVVCQHITSGQKQQQLPNALNSIYYTHRIRH